MADAAGFFGNRGKLEPALFGGSGVRGSEGFYWSNRYASFTVIFESWGLDTGEAHLWVGPLTGSVCVAYRAFEGCGR